MDDGSNIFSLENIRNGWLKFFEDMFRHVLQTTEGIDFTTTYDFSSVVQKFERFAHISGFKPATEYEYESALESYFSSLGFYSAPRSASSALASAAGCASASGYTPSSKSASGSESASGCTPLLESGYASASGYTPSSECASGSASASGYTSLLESASSLLESASGSEWASGYTSAAEKCMTLSELTSGFASASGYTPSSKSASGYESASGYAPASEFKLDFSDMFNTYDRNLGLSIQRVLNEVAGTDIDKFYQSIKDKIKIKEHLKTFLNRLAGKFLNASPQQELYFLTIISRIFSLAYITSEMNPKVFIEAVADTIFENEMDLQLASINPAELILNILRDSKCWIRDFRDLSCGNALDYFST